MPESPKPFAEPGHSLSMTQTILDGQGLRPLIAHLASLSAYRCVGVYRFEGDTLCNVVHYDKLEPDLEHLAAIPVNTSYCSFVRDSRGHFSTADSLLDLRLDDHPKREALRSYVGIPILNPEGLLLGTLCHYDTVPRDPDELDWPLLIETASALADRFESNHAARAGS